MSLEQKIVDLNNSIVREVELLGLQFVTGPGPEAFSFPGANLGTTNGQPRGVYLFGVAEA